MTLTFLFNKYTPYKVNLFTEGDNIMKVAVIGSRSLNVDVSCYIPSEATTIVTGGAKGIDSLAEKYADEHNLKKIIFKPQYELYKKVAPIKRNILIVNEADLIVAIWDGKSKGTKFTIDYAKKINKSIRIFIVS